MRRRGKRARNSGIFWIIGITCLLGILAFAFDNQILSIFQSMQNPAVTAVLSLFKPSAAMALIGLFFIALLAIKHKRKWAVPLAATLFISTSISFIIKFIVMRPRPFGIVETLPILNLVDYSFPSNHTVFIFSCLPILDRQFPKIKHLWIALACLVGISRVYFAAHYPSDVVFGGLLGYLAGYFILKTAEKL